MRDSTMPEEMALDGVRSWVLDQLGIRFDPAQEYIFKTRMEMFCRTRRFTAKDALKRLRTGDPTTVMEVAEVVSTNHTSFFREPEMFDYFTSTIFPSFPKSGALRLWSAAASSGEEAYSMAFCLRHALGESAKSRVRILGTDISERQIKRAEAGIYPRAELGRDVRPLLEPVGTESLGVPASIKEMCVFRRMNLTQLPWPFGQKFHVIFMRNVLYYFEQPMQTRILESCYEAALPGAWLVTSLTEPLLDVETRWSRLCPGVQRKDR